MLTDYIPINWAIIKSPVNWMTVVLMIAFGCFAIDLVKMYVANKGSN